MHGYAVLRDGGGCIRAAGGAERARQRLRCASSSMPGKIKSMVVRAIGSSANGVQKAFREASTEGWYSVLARG